MNREKILEDIEAIQNKINEEKFKGSNEHDLHLRTEIVDYIISNYEIYNVSKNTDIHSSEISVRLYRILIDNCPLFRENKGYTKLQVLENLSISDFLRYPGAGPKALYELTDLCKKINITLNA